MQTSNPRGLDVMNPLVRSLHDQTMPELELWQQNFLMLNNLTICAVGATSIHAANPGGLEWGFNKIGTLAGWVAQYKGRTHPPSVEHMEDAARYALKRWLKDGP